MRVDSSSQRHRWARRDPGFSGFRGWCQKGWRKEDIFQIELVGKSGA